MPGATGSDGSRRASHRNSGAPNRAVTTPAATSLPVGEVTRASRSAASSSVAPHRAAAGSRTTCRRTPASRTRCGAARPTKPIGPVTATAHAVSSTDSSTAVSRTRPTGTPSPRAVSSPVPRMSSVRASSSPPPSPAASSGSTVKDRALSATARDPCPQKNTAPVSSWKSTTSTAVTLDSASVTDTPASTRWAGRPRDPPATVWTSAAASSPPAKATPPRGRSPGEKPVIALTVTAR
ncbi:hypothetical protein BG846_04586 [Streptomyces fradiae ATCC 10745 = DSM 40063]|uniref:Uncharacterized protein n=1 Tax=Streptomyces fradiae ATCC 10745 = DSM 40063 TaxID=1319510 RepID=A0A1Y2NQK8_STRFR|nr:hypothetical protein BG846_04586 [Streptomyces fradiae ATCC 10745 = DSM 40063]